MSYTLLYISAAGLALGEKIAEEDQLAVSSSVTACSYIYLVSRGQSTFFCFLCGGRENGSGIIIVTTFLDTHTHTHTLVEGVNEINVIINVNVVISE